MNILLIIACSISALIIITGLTVAAYLSIKDKDDHIGHIITAVVITIIVMVIFGL